MVNVRPKAGVNHGSSWSSEKEILRHNADRTDESRLWRACMIRAIDDAAWGTTELRRDVWKWLNHADFDCVCYYASVSADYIYLQITTILTVPLAARRRLVRKLREAILLKDGVAKELPDMCSH